MKLTCVMACHNEEAYLPYSLAMLQRAPVDKLIVVLDRCCDRSKRIIQQCWRKPLTIYAKEKTTWQNSCAEAKNTGLTLAEDGLVFMTDADIAITSGVMNSAVDVIQVGRILFEWDKTLQILAFTYRQYSLFGSVLARVHDEISNFSWLVSRKLGWMPTHSGIYMMRSGIAKLEDKPSEYNGLMTAHETKVADNNLLLHLRPKRSRQDQLHRGKARAHMKQYSLFKTLVAALLTLQPYVLLGYLREKKKLADKGVK